MNENELKHYGVLGMKWGRRRGRVSTKSSKQTEKQKNETSKNSKAKFAKGAKIAAGILAVSGGIAVSAFMVKRARETGRREGMIAAQKEMKMFRRAAAAKGAATRAANRAAQMGRSAANSTLSSIGRLNVQDLMSMVR